MKQIAVVADREVMWSGSKSVLEYVRQHVQAKIEFMEIIRIPEKCATAIWYRVKEGGE